MLLEGPVGTGKTRAWLEKIHALCQKFPNYRVLLLRQVRADLAGSVLVTFETQVLPPGHYLHDGSARENRYSYKYSNGSEIVLGGLDRPGRVMSADYDLIYVAEATQISEDSLELLLTRLRQNTIGWHQLAMCCNPDMEHHWLNKRCKAGKTVRLISTLQDNPAFWDGVAWTDAGANYLKAIGGITGHRYERLVLGKWCSPEGARFKNISRQLQGFDLYTEFPYGLPEHYKRWLCVDYGKADPYCCLWVVRDENMAYWVYQEDYAAGFEADEQIQRIIDKCASDERYEGIWMDGSMWQKGEYARSFGAQGEKGSAAKQYWDAIRTLTGKFGQLHKGSPNKDERNYIDLSALLTSGQLRIARSCVNLWDEIEGAVHYKDPRTGIQSELINPGGKKYCPDHALDALCYGIVNRSPVTTPVEDGAIDMAAVMAERERVRNEAYECGRMREDVPKWRR